MRKFIVTFLFLVVILSNGFGQTYDLNIPDTVVVKKTDKHIQIPGTRVFMIKPEGFILKDSVTQLVWEKDPHVSITVKDGLSTQYPEENDYTKRNIKYNSEHNEGGYVKEFKLGNYDAFFSYSSRYSNYFNFTFGSKEFYTDILAYIPRKDEKTKQEVFEAILSAYIDTNATADFTLFDPYTIDISNSKFKPSYTLFTHMLYYTMGHVESGMGFPSLDHFFIYNINHLTKSNGEIPRKEIADTLIAEYKSQYKNISSFKEEKLKINNEDAYEISFIHYRNNQTLLKYMVIFGNDKKTFAFDGCASEHFDMMRREFRKVAMTLKMK